MNEKHEEFTEGDAVRITRGIFDSFLGTVVNVDNQNRRLTVLGRLETEPNSDLHSLNVSSYLVEKSGGVVQNSQTILLVEDDETVRNFAHEVLESYGYRLLAAANGLAALSICERYKKSIHLLLTDVVMPGMGGRSIANRLAQLRPEMKVLYMSGYTDDVIVHHGVLNEGVHFLQKPFTPEDLWRKVREVLDAKEKPLSERK